MCWHKWSKWETYKCEMNRYIYRTDKTFTYMETRQRRKCEKCGYTQDKEVREY